MIEIKVTSEILEEAKRRTSEAAKRFGDRGTHRLNSDRQKSTGYLAEVCINHEFPDIKYSDD